MCGLWGSLPNQQAAWMVKLTPDDWAAVELRANGYTYSLIALEQDCSIDEVKARIDRVTRVLMLRLNAELDGPDGPDDSP